MGFLCHFGTFVLVAERAPAENKNGPPSHRVDSTPTRCSKQQSSSAIESLTGYHAQRPSRERVSSNAVHGKVPHRYAEKSCYLEPHFTTTELNISKRWAVLRDVSRVELTVVSWSSDGYVVAGCASRTAGRRSTCGRVVRFSAAKQRTGQGGQNAKRTRGSVGLATDPTVDQPFHVAHRDRWLAISLARLASHYRSAGF